MIVELGLIFSRASTCRCYVLTVFLAMVVGVVSNTEAYINNTMIV